MMDPSNAMLVIAGVNTSLNNQLPCTDSVTCKSVGSGAVTKLIVLKLFAFETYAEKEKEKK